MPSQPPNFITAIDVGSAKTCVLVAEISEHGLRYRGHGISESTQPEPQATPAASAAAPAEIAARHAQVYALLDEGLTPYQIADRIGRPEGEVELIIALRPRDRAGV